MMLESDSAPTAAQPTRPGAHLLNHPPLLLSRALLLLADDWTTSDAVRWLDPKLILAESWKSHRLQRCCEQLAAGLQAPPIAVVGFRLGRRRVLYGVSDGMHRTVAHREAGRKVKARIGGYHLIEPARHALWKDHLWRREGQGLRMIVDAPDELHPILVALGVEAT